MPAIDRSRTDYAQLMAGSAECCASSQRTISQTQELVTKTRETIALSWALMKRVDERMRR